MSDSADDGPLPEGGDPYAILGVEPDADLRTLKRAHARLIRRFRPERDPENFKRVQAAYEMARRWSKLYDRLRATHEDGEDRSEAGGGSRAMENTTPGRGLGREDAQGGDTWPLDPPTTRALSRVEWLVEGIAAAARFDLEELQRLPREEFIELALDPRLTWSRLAPLPQRAVALSLHRERIEQLMLSDDLDRALSEAEALLPAVVREPRLEAQIRVVAAAGAWHHPHRAHRLVGRIPESLELPHAEELLAAAQSEIDAVAPRWRALDRGSIPAALVRFVELSRVLSSPNRGALRSELARDFRSRPRSYQSGIDAIAARARPSREGPRDASREPDPLSFVWASFALEAPTGVPGLGLLELEERERLEERLRALDARLEALRAPTTGELLLRLLSFFLAIGAAFAWRPAAGLMVALLTHRLFGEHGKDAREGLFADEVRPELIAAAVAGDLPPGALIERLRAAQSGGVELPHLAEHLDALGADRALEAIAMLGWTVQRW